MSPFHEEWMETLRAQYIHSVKTKDSNSRSLRNILEEAGFTEGQLEEYEIIATMEET